MDIDGFVRTISRFGKIYDSVDSKLKDIFWTHVVHTKVHIQNILMLRNNNDKTAYELWKGRPTNVKRFRLFGSKCYIKREDEKMGKFEFCVCYHSVNLSG
jgi:hypothetical protein